MMLRGDVMLGAPGFVRPVALWHPVTLTGAGTQQKSVGVLGHGLMVVRNRWSREESLPAGLGQCACRPQALLSVYMFGGED